MDTNFTDILIIGNGFDLNQGLKTGYQDFVKSEEFDHLLKENNHLGIYLNNKNELERWIDIENELTNYSKYTAHVRGDIGKDFYKNFVLLSNSLKQYLYRISNQPLQRKSHSYKLIEKLIDSNFVIFDFNYTETTKKILVDLGLPLKEIDKRLTKVHGSLQEEQIIFGVEDNAEINPTHVFLRKAYNQSFKGTNINYALNKTENLHIFGHSLGKTDHMYFREFFHSHSLYGNHNQRKQIDLYYFREEGYHQSFMQLDEMTQNKLSILKQNNSVKTIDVSTEFSPSNSLEFKAIESK